MVRIKRNLSIADPVRREFRVNEWEGAWRMPPLVGSHSTACEKFIGLEHSTRCGHRPGVAVNRFGDLPLP